MIPTSIFSRRLLFGGLLALALLASPPRVYAYVEAPHSFGAIVAQSTHIMLLRIEKVDKEKNLIIYSKVRDIKGKHPTDVIKHNIGRGGFHPREWQVPMQTAEPGKLAVFFHNGGASETCLGLNWYQAYPGGEWWNMSHGEPFLLRSFAGSPEKLAGLVQAMLDGKEVVVPCMVDGNKDDLHHARGRIQRLRASLKLLDYNPKRDFVGWGGDDFRRMDGLAGFTHISSLSRIDPEAHSVSSVDMDGDGKPDLCLAGANRVSLLQNGGEAMSETSLPGVRGARAAVWADYNGDKKPDLFLATPMGPRLFTNLGQNQFRDDTALLPREPGYNLTAAAWLDYDGDGKPDLLLGNGFHGLRLYRNKGVPPAVAPAQPKLGKWRVIGPFEHAGGQGFDKAFPPEKELAFDQKYPGKANETAAWRDGAFTDGAVNSLAIFKNNSQAVAYLHREIESVGDVELPISLGSDDTLTVWLNGQKLLAENVYRGAEPNQNQLKLKLKAGKNDLLLKICNGDGDFAFYFAAGQFQPAATQEPCFEDVSLAVGLGPTGIGSVAKGDLLTVADVNGDGRPDFLYGAGQGLLALNTATGFVEAKDSGIAYQTGKVRPVFGDFDGDGHLDLFVPQKSGCKLFRNDGKGRFTDVTAKTGALAKLAAHATSAAWGDVNRDGKLDLVIGCLHGPNRCFRNMGDGTFSEITESLGLEQKIFNTQAVGLVDLNKDGVLDFVFSNEGQDSCVLLGRKE